MGKTTFKPGIEKEAWFPEWLKQHFPELVDEMLSPGANEPELKAKPKRKKEDPGDADEVSPE
jgi:hypothetical protein